MTKVFINSNRPFHEKGIAKATTERFTLFHKDWILKRGDLEFFVLRSKLAIITQIIRASRKLSGFTQSDLASKIQISQSTLSKVEKGLLSFEFMKWFDFCDATGIDEDSCKIGYIDQIKEIQLDSQEYFGSFRIPPKYFFLKSNTNRWLMPLLSSLKASLGHQEYKNFMRTEGFDPDFFSVYHLTTNLNFPLKLISLLSKDSSPTWIEDLAFPLSTPENHGILRKNYNERMKWQKKLTKLLIKSQKYNQINFLHQIEDEQEKGITVSFKPAMHTKEFEYKNAGSFFCDFEKASLKASSQLLGHPPISLIEKECHFKGNDQCIYQISF